MRVLVGSIMTLVLSVGGGAGCGEEKRATDPPRQPAPSLDAGGCETPEAPQFSVTSSPVIGDGTATNCDVNALRAALMAGGHISFDCGASPVTIPVDATLLVGDATLVDGGGKVTLDGGGNVQILRIADHASVVLRGLAFHHGHSSDVGGSGDAGGALYRGWQSRLYIDACEFTGNVAEGTLGFGGGAIATASSGWTTIVRSVFTENRSRLGGAIHSMLSDLFVVESRFEANEATSGDGGAIFTDGAYTPPKTEHGVLGGTISLCGSAFVNNWATSSAGAGFLYAYGVDQLIVNRCQFDGNRVSTKEPGLGGAIRIDADAFVSNSLFVNNQTAGQGGAVWMGRGPAVFENVTFYANHASLWGGAISYGNVPVAFNSCTVARNMADAGSDGLFGLEGALVANNTILAENGVAASPNRHCRVPLLGARNLVYPATEKDVCGVEFVHDDPKLDADLGEHGGPTRTLALDPGSAAVGLGADCPATDQRGEPRDRARCALGAFEP
jgi:hypothetical protein